MQLLKDVFDNYLITKAKLQGKAAIVGAPDQVSLLTDLPKFFMDLLEDRGRASEFKVEGSIGNGNMARVPWVGIFNRKVTESAQDGYYIVLLFSENMQSCHLSLNQGVTAFEKQYTRKLALSKIASAAMRSLKYFVYDPYSEIGKIDLNATGDLGEGYEFGAIESYRYYSVALPSASTVADNFLTLLNHYDSLIPVAGTSLQTLVPVSEAEFQQVAMESAVAGPAGITTLPVESGGVPAPAKNEIGNFGYQRNVRVAALALKQANFKCEIVAEHRTFISSAKRRPYVEAHHLVPMSKQESFEYSLDVPANVVALCAHCHKLLHHGENTEKRKQLLKLFGDRLERLKKMEILLDAKTLLSFYSKDSLDDE